MTASTRNWWWFFCFQFFLAEQIARLGWVGHYSMARNYISDLGMLRCDVMGCSHLHWLMNGSFLLQGVLIAAGALSLRSFLPRFLWLLFAMAGLGVLLVGLVPEGVAFPLHLLGAAAHFTAGNLAMVFWGVLLLRRHERWRGILSVLAGTVGIMATCVLGFRMASSFAVSGWGPGIVERIAAYPLPLWLTWTGCGKIASLRPKPD